MNKHPKVTVNPLAIYCIFITVRGNRIKIISRYQSIIYLTIQSQKGIDDDNLALFVSKPMKCSSIACSTENQEVVLKAARSVATDVGYSLGAVDFDAVALITVYLIGEKEFPSIPQFFFPKIQTDLTEAIKKSLGRHFRFFPMIVDERLDRLYCPYC